MVKAAKINPNGLNENPEKLFKRQLTRNLTKPFYEG